MSVTEAPPEVREHLAVALDLDDSVAALRMARELRPWFGVAKVGLELYKHKYIQISAALRALAFVHDDPDSALHGQLGFEVPF